MNLNQIINMIVRTVMRRGINAGINRGIDMAGRAGKRSNDDTPSERETVENARNDR